MRVFKKNQGTGSIVPPSKIFGEKPVKIGHHHRKGLALIFYKHMANKHIKPLEKK